MTTVNSFFKLGQVIENRVQAEIKDFALAIWDEVVLSPIHPRDTGTLQHSWKMIPYIGGGSGNAGDTYKPVKDQYGKPDKLNLDKYSKRWTNYVLFNNQPYTMVVNDNQDKPYANWIEQGFYKAVERFK